MHGLLKRFVADQSAATAIEYGLITALIAAVMISGLNALGNQLNSVTITIGTSMASASLTQ